MIQRIQSIYLTVAAIAMALTLVFPFATYSIVTGNFVYDSFGFVGAKDLSFFLPVIFPIVISILLSLVSIFSFKKRKRQLLFNKLNFLVIMISIVFVFVNFNQIESTFSLLPENMNYGIGFFFPIIAFVAIIMANRSINQDEKLIKSMDRIR
ncbi:MAG: DUF4293 domain-containing protein [Flavobacteriales bacterium]|jgi:hypothetical protein